MANLRARIGEETKCSLRGHIPPQLQWVGEGQCIPQKWGIIMAEQRINIPPTAAHTTN